jgi:hypothetical protein
MNQTDTRDQLYGSYPYDGFNEFCAPDITAWKLARSAIEHENNLINHRLTWFFSAQAFLLTAFFVVVSYSDKPILKELDALRILPVLFLIIGFLAIYMCLVTQNGLERAYTALDNITRHYDQLAARHVFSRTPPLHFWKKPTLFNSRYIPVVTVVMWIALEGVCALARIPSLQAATAQLTGEQAMFGAGVLLALIGAIAVGYLWGTSRKREDRYWNR